MKATDLTRAVRYGAVVLCGGGSRRMGCDKASLPFGPGRTMLQCVVHQLGQAVSADRIAVVASARQRLPSLPPATIVVRDETEGEGPLPALALGIETLGGRVDAVFASGCDAPLLKPEFARFALERLAAVQRDARRGRPFAAVPRGAGQWYPLAAAYNSAVGDVARRVIRDGNRSLRALLSAIAVEWIDLSTFAAVDADQRSLLNCNTAEQYARAQAVAGFVDSAD